MLGTLIGGTPSQDLLNRLNSRFRILLEKVDDPLAEQSLVGIGSRFGGLLVSHERSIVLFLIGENDSELLERQPQSLPILALCERDFPCGLIFLSRFETLTDALLRLRRNYRQERRDECNGTFHGF